jgi:3-hydroxyisobutyrate dehydrogenase
LGTLEIEVLRKYYDDQVWLLLRVDLSANLPKIGFIGLGLMGKPMAQNLLKKNYSITVYNRSKKSVEELAESGAKVASSPKEVAENSEIVIDMVTDAPDVEEVILGSQGVIYGASQGMIVIDMSTNSPDIANLVGSELEKKAVEFLDAPVSGGDKGAREGTLTIMVGGKKEIFEHCLPVFEAMGKTITYMGKTGSGQAMKLCNQVAVSIHTLATSEALLFGTSFGLKSEEILKVLTSGAANSWNLQYLGPKIVARDFEPGFKAAHLYKDLKAIIRTAEKESLILPATTTAYELFGAVLASKNGEKGTQVVVRVLEKLAEKEIR